MGGRKKDDKGPAPAPKWLENAGEYFGKVGGAEGESALQVESVHALVDGDPARGGAKGEKDADKERAEKLLTDVASASLLPTSRPEVPRPATLSAPIDRATAGTWLHRALNLPNDATPFPWQQRLLARFLEGDIPRALDIPTGLGKTSVMAIWLVARALGAPVPRRLVYVVDRRAVVDQATTIALELKQLVDDQSALRDALGLGQEAETGHRERSLPISTLRGQHVDKREWLDDPSAPAIVVGTVDMVGSRLLFSGYGVSSKMRPYHAGFLGADTLLVLDEAHIVPAFERLLESVSSANERGLGPSEDARIKLPAFRLLSLSATGKTGPGTHALSNDDHAHAIVQKRVNARKLLALRPAVGKAELGVRLAKEAHDLAAKAAEPIRIVIFCDTRDDAVKAEKELRRLSGKQQPPLELFVGGRRVHERQKLARWLTAHGFLAGGQPPKTTAFLIATSAAEVGVDLDADAAVADVVAWERMVQRLGRVNRRGNVAATVVLVPLDGDERLPDQRRGSLALLDELPQEGELALASPSALVALRERATADAALATTFAAATTPAPLHPPLTRPLLDAWSMTSLREHTGRPEVGPWLRGWVEDDEPQTTIVFRAHLPNTNDGKPLEPKLMQSFLETAGPHASEQLETETWRVLGWLDARIEDIRKTPRLEAPTSDSRDDIAAGSRVWALALDARKTPPRITPVTWDALRDPRRRKGIERDLAGAVVLTDSRLGGLSPSGLLDDDASADDSAAPLDLTEPDMHDPDNAVPFRVRRIQDLESACSEGFETDRTFVIGFDGDGAPNSWLRVEHRIASPALSETGRSVASHEQGLEEHQAWVKDEARAIAGRLGLGPELTRVLEIAGRLHDEGKRAERWQRAFHVPPEKRALAKSRRAPNVKALGGYRHELGSLPRVERDSAFAQLSKDDRDLVLHLVAAHHGRARPILPTDGAEEAPTVLALRAREVALRFDHLSRRYGPWGLAWLESLLRAADARASRRNEQRGNHG